MSLEPKLTKLDHRILAQLREDRARRARDVADEANLLPRPDYIGQEQLRRDRLEEVRGILRGLEHLGYATGRGGWWRKTTKTGGTR